MIKVIVTFIEDAVPDIVQANYSIDTIAISTEGERTSAIALLGVISTFLEYPKHGGFLTPEQEGFVRNRIPSIMKHFGLYP